MYIDADTHVYETEETWTYLRPEEKRFRPVKVELDLDDTKTIGIREIDQRFWLVDGQLRSWLKADFRAGTSPGQRELSDIPSRLKHMDELGIETQIIYPTFHLAEVTDKPEVELALCRAYNRWLGEKCSGTQGRLRWAAVLPLRSIPDAIEEARESKKRGAVAVTAKPFGAGSRPPHDPYFFPLYEVLDEIDLPLCFHSGAGGWQRSEIDMMLSGRFGYLTVLIPGVFNAAWRGQLSQKFPKLRIGFIEAMASWLPWIIRDAKTWAQRSQHNPSDTVKAEDVDRSASFLKQHRFYVTCEVTEDLPYLLPWTGPDNLIIGTDYSHGDSASNLYAHKELMERDDIPPDVAKRIVYDNAIEFYGL